jgi:hypothetical protein
MLLWTLLVGSLAAFGIAGLPTLLPRGVVVLDARLPLTLFGTVLAAAGAGLWLLGSR